MKAKWDDTEGHMQEVITTHSMQTMNPQKTEQATNMLVP